MLQDNKVCVWHTSLWKTHMNTTVECVEGFKERNMLCWKAKM